LFVMWCVQNPSRCSLLRWPVVQWIGACSYGIYLWQELFTGPANVYHGWNVAQSFLLASIAILICAGMSHYLIEQPCIRLGRSLSNRLRPLKDCIHPAEN
jgi:peptidoglycan/LPS O-acetylase OafA/YrhL